jgi:hypothetical protein
MNNEEQQDQNQDQDNLLLKNDPMENNPMEKDNANTNTNTNSDDDNNLMSANQVDVKIVPDVKSNNIIVQICSLSCACIFPRQ